MEARAKMDLMNLLVDVLKDIPVTTVVYVSFEQSIIGFLYVFKTAFTIFNFYLLLSTVHKELQSKSISLISYFQMIHVKFVSRFKIKDMMMTIWDGMIREDAEHVMIIAAGLEIVLVEATHH